MATLIDPKDFNRYEVVKVSPLPAEPLNVVLSSGTAEKPTSLDAFGRLRVANPLTLFDSSHRYQDNDLWATDTATGGTSTFSANEGLINLAVTTSSGSRVYRETTRVFSYQPGKALKNGEPVLTPSGWKKIETLKVGDEVFDGNGEITEVVGVYPQGARKIFRFTFDDGSIVDADEDHLWVTIRRRSTKKFKKGDKHILTTREMIDLAGNEPTVQNRWRIPCCPTLKMPEKPVLIDPYTLGAILGDGGVSHSASATFTTSDEEILDYIVCEKIVKRKGSKYGYGLNGLSSQLRHYGLNHKNAFTKFVPDDYKFNCESVRLEILKGLMDTDGWVEKDGWTYFSTVSSTLAEDVEYLVRSLGGTAKTRKKEGNFYYNKSGIKVVCSPSYHIKISIPVNPFKLTRKHKKWRLKYRTSFDRYVYSIKELGVSEATCIRVASQDHTFITRNHIVTHNSLLILTTFVFSPAKTNLRQRVGYFGTANGIYLELNNSTLSFVERSSVTGSLVETKVTQDSWNIDKLDGTGPSGLTLDITKAQILWADVEWLGLGTVRIGFIIDGKFIHCHSFNHANIITSTYITTASLPLRYEIENTGATASSSTMKQVCSSIISEGGYELRGAQQAVSVPVTAPVTLATAGTTYPVLSVRLKTSPNRLDAIVVLLAASILGTSSNTIYSWQVLSGSTTTGGTWVSAGTNSSVEYKIDGGAVSGGRVIASGFINSTNQSSPTINILRGSLFSNQLERNSFTSTPYEITLAITANTNTAVAFASLDFEEISR